MWEEIGLARWVSTNPYAYCYALLEQSPDGATDYNGNGNGNENISNAPPTVDRRRIYIVHECLFIGAQ